MMNMQKSDASMNVLASYGLRRLIPMAVFLLLAGCANAERIKMNDTNHIVKVGEMTGESGYSLNILSFHPSGKYLAATSSVHGKVFVFDVEKMKLIKTLDKGDSKNSDKLAFSSDGKYLIGQSEVIKGQRNFRLWDVTRDYTIISDDKKYRGSSRIYPGPDNKIYSYSGWSRNIPKLFIHTVPDMELTEYLHDLPGPRMMSISPNGKYMVDSWVLNNGKIGGADNTSHLRIWRYPSLELEREILNMDSIATSFGWTKDSSQFLYALPSNSYPERWSDAKKEEARKNKKYHESVILFDVESGKELKRIGPVSDSPVQIYFLENERYIIALTEGRGIDVWDIKNNKLIERRQLTQTTWAFNGLQNPVNKNQFVYNHKDQLWVFEVRGLDVDVKGE